MIKDTRVVKDAVYLIDDNSMRSRSDVQSGWDFDDRGEKTANCEEIRGLYLCSDETSDLDPYLSRRFVPVKTGKAGFFHNFRLRYGEDFYLRFLSDDKKESVALEITAKDGLFCVGGTKIPVAAENKTYSLGIEFDLDRKKAAVSFDDVNYGTFKLTAKSLARLIIGVKGGHSTCYIPLTVRLWINYLICDRAYVSAPGSMSGAWRLTAKGAALADRRPYTEGQNLTTYALVTADGKVATLERKFDAVKTKICFEIKYLPKTDTDDIAISLISGRKPVLLLHDNGKALLHENALLREHHVNVWQTLRMEANFSTGKALVKLNGKKCCELPLADGAKKADGIRLSYTAPNGGILKFTDIFVFEMQPEPADYVPEPILPKKKDYYVGMNICSLWRNGGHWGWDVISPYHENKTYMGYYDEGLPEVADWEIKWMAEHGLDFELYCWYNSQVNAPICTTGLSAAIHGGHFNAKYGDYMKFALLWEAMNCAHPSVEAFRKHIVPYWMDYFFSDPRYFTIDNKVLIAVFGSGNLIKDFGSVEAVKEQLDYVREEVKKLGFDGAIFLSCGGPTEAVRDCGFDGVYAYNWGTQGFDPDYTKAQITSQREKKLVHVVPTVSTGFNRIGWGSPRTPQMTCEDMGECLRWFKEDVLPTSEGEDWKKKLVMFSTWNEYGEGTYICPSNLHGFGYLDEMRKAFTNESASHTDIRPDEHQLDRLGYLYPKGRSLIRCEQYLEKCKPTEHVDDIPTDAAYWQPENGLMIQNRDGKLCGTTDKFDPQILHTGLSIDANEVKGVHIRLKANSGGGANTCVYFITDTDSAWSESKGVHVFIKGDVVTDVYYDMASLPTWTGTITGLRLDPTDIAGSFEIEAIELTTDTTSPIITVDGEIHTPSVLPKITDKGVFIPFEQNRPYKALKFYHEWYRDEQTLYLLHGKTAMYFTVGKDYVLVNGKKHKLPEPLALCDALPMLSLDVLCDLCGFSYTVEGRYIRILSNEKK